MHCHYYMNIMSVIYLRIVNFADAFSKCRKIFKCYFFLSIIEAVAVPLLSTVVVPLTSMYASL